MKNTRLELLENMTRNTELIVGGMFVTLAVIVNFGLMGIPVAALNFGLIISYIVWASNSVSEKAHIKIIPIFGAGIIIQGFHFWEEYSTGFQTRFPAIFGVRWSDGPMNDFFCLTCFGFSCS